MKAMKAMKVTAKRTPVGLDVTGETRSPMKARQVKTVMKVMKVMKAKAMKKAAKQNAGIQRPGYYWRSHREVVT